MFRSMIRAAASLISPHIVLCRFVVSRCHSPKLFQVPNRRFHDIAMSVHGKCESTALTFSGTTGDDIFDVAKFQPPADRLRTVGFVAGDSPGPFVLATNT